jgi:alpha-tubulin suppressor-like RCC1 family protein
MDAMFSFGRVALRVIVVSLLLTAAGCGDSDANGGGQRTCPTPPAECNGTFCSADRRTVQLCELRDGCPQVVARDTCHSKAVCAGAEGAASCHQIGAGNRHVCVLWDGKVRCWGSGSDGALGNGSTENVGDAPNRLPLSPSNTVSFVDNQVPIQLSAGVSHTCALLRGGAVQCWGDNFQKQLGIGEESRLESRPVQAVAVAQTMVAVFAGDSATCAIAEDRTLLCWGSNGFNQFGLAEGQGCANCPYGVPVQPGFFDGGIVDFAMTKDQVAANTCAIVGQAVRCNGRGGPGTGMSETGLNEGLSSPVAVQVGNGYTCAVERGGALRCWRFNGNGQLGGGDTSTTKTLVSVLSNVSSAAIGFRHGCAVTGDATLYCWGDNRDGAVGNGESGPEVIANTPRLVAELNDVVQVTAAAEGGPAASSFTCALTAGGNVWCWGMNNYGQLGLGVADMLRAKPTQAVGYD